MLPGAPPPGARALSLSTSRLAHRRDSPARAFRPQVSLALLAKDLGATPARLGSVASMSRLSASIAEHGSRLFLKISRRISATATTAGDGTGGEATV